MLFYVYGVTGNSEETVISKKVFVGHDKISVMGHFKWKGSSIGGSISIKGVLEE